MPNSWMIRSQGVARRRIIIQFVTAGASNLFRRIAESARRRIASRKPRCGAFAARTVHARQTADSVADPPDPSSETHISNDWTDTGRSPTFVGRFVPQPRPSRPQSPVAKIVCTTARVNQQSHFPREESLVCEHRRLWYCIRILQQLGSLLKGWARKNGLGLIEAAATPNDMPLGGFSTARRELCFAVDRAH